MPVFFRKATQVAAYLFYPLVFIFTSWVYVDPTIATEAPFLRVFLAAVAIAYAWLHWSRSNSYGWFVACRFAVQLLLIATVADSLKYSFFSQSVNPFTKEHTITALSMIFIWTISFLGQTLIALFIPKKNKTVAAYERFVEIISLLGIIVTPVFAVGFDSQTVAIVRIIIYAIIAILGLAYSVIHKNVFWSVATLASLLFIPGAVSEAFLFQIDGWGRLLYYTFYGFVVLAGYKMLGEKQKNAFIVSIIGLSVASIALLSSGTDAGYIEVAWLVIASLLALLGYMSERKVLYELSIYAGACCLYSLLGTVDDMLSSNHSSVGEMTKCAGYYGSQVKCMNAKNETLSTFIDVVKSFVIPSAFIWVSFWKERKAEERDKWRFVLGYVMLSLSLLSIGWNSDDGWMIVSLATQVGFLIYAVLKNRTWLIWSSVILLVISLLYLTGGFTYVWLAVLGIILILVVVWRLSRINEANKAENKDSNGPDGQIDAHVDGKEHHDDEEHTDDNNESREDNDDHPEDNNGNHDSDEGHPEDEHKD